MTLARRRPENGVRDKARKPKKIFSAIVEEATLCEMAAAVQRMALA